MSNKKKRIALLTSGNTETSWLLINALYKLDDVETSIICSKRSPEMSIRSRVSRMILRCQLILHKFIFSYDVIGLQKPPSHQSINYVDDVNGAEVSNILDNFKPDILMISGTKKVDDSILRKAKYALNLHHGYVPFYKGVSSLNWVLQQRNFNFFYWTVHEAVTALDSGKVLECRPIQPLIGETYKLFRRRLNLEGAEGFIKLAINSMDAVEMISQPKEMLHHTFRHKDKPKNFECSARAIFNSGDMKRFKLTRGQQAKRFGRIVKKVYTPKLTRSNLSSGLYILNYHDFCSEEEAQYFKGRTSSIYTSEKQFHAHLDYFQDNFELVSLSEGLKLWQSGTISNKKILCISFDDGLSTTFDAIQACNDYGFSPSLFVNGDPLFNSRPLHNHSDLLCLRYALQHSERNYKELKTPYAEILNDGWDSNDDFSAFLKNSYLNIDTLIKLKEHNSIEPGSHTYSHVPLNNDTLAAQEQHIAEFHMRLTKAINGKVSYFSYPFGKLDMRSFKSDYVAFKTAEYVFDCNGGINHSAQIPGPILRIGVHNETVTELDKLLKVQWVR